MVKERLSQLQVTILTYLHLDYTEGKRVGGSGCNYRTLRDIMTNDSDRNSFRSKFSRSIRNLEKKQLIDVTYCHQIQKREYRQIKKCEGKKPEDDKPCKNCFYVKKYRHRLAHLGSDIQFISNNNSCGFYFITGYCGRDVRKKRIGEVKITDKGVAAILKAVVTPEMRRDAEKNAKWQISQLEQLSDYENESKKKLKRKSKELLAK